MFWGKFFYFDVAFPALLVCFVKRVAFCTLVPQYSFHYMVLDMKKNKKQNPPQSDLQAHSKRIYHKTPNSQHKSLQKTLSINLTGSVTVN